MQHQQKQPQPHPHPHHQAGAIAINGGDPKSTSNGEIFPRRSRRRVLNVEEALRFSPLTTSPSTGLGRHSTLQLMGRVTDCFTTERIPLPELGAAHNSSSLISKSDRAQVFKSLEDLKQPQYRSNGPSEYKRVFHEVQKHLKAEDLPDLSVPLHRHIV